MKTRYYSNKQENRIAKQLKGHKQANSGATKFNKGDVITGLFLIEAKTHTQDRNSFTIQKEWITKNSEEAFAMGKPYSALAIDFGDGRQHYIINESLFTYLHEKLQEDENL